jgi:hypothetical protein
MIYRQENLPFYQFEILSRVEGIGHIVTTRSGGVSPPPRDSLNLSFGNGDKKAHIQKNLEVLSRAIGIASNHIITANQVHGSRVKVVSHLDNDGPDDSDALITAATGICVMVLTADCVPILLCDPARRVVGAVHAGWKGTLEGIAQKAVDVFVQNFGAQPQDMMAGIGPSIGPCCFEVGPEVEARFIETWGTWDLRRGKKEGKNHIDLWNANARQLIHAGIPESQIEIANLCTCHNVDTFFSYRSEGATTGRFGTGIYLI